MRKILSHRGLRFIFLANMISMIGSGMNTAAVTWYVLQATKTEIALSWLLIVQTVPAMLLMPLSGVIIDREDRRHIVMVLDAGRGLMILAVAMLALTHHIHLWQLYAMGIVVATGFWMFWPTINALIQELTPESEFVHSNTFLLAGIQGGWLLAGAFVGFVYNHIGLGGILLIDFLTYVASFTCYLFVRQGRHVVQHPQREESFVKKAAAENAVARYFHEMRDGFRFVRASPFLILISTSWAMFLGAMLTTGVVTAPLSDRVLHAGAVGYGWLNGGWAIGAVVSTVYTAWLISKLGSRYTVALTMAILSFCWFALPYSPMLAIAVALYGVGGSARGITGVALSTAVMETVPKHLMGRVQNVIYLSGSMLQLLLGMVVGYVAHHRGLAPAFAIIATLYLGGFVAALVPVKEPLKERAEVTVA